MIRDVLQELEAVEAALPGSGEERAALERRRDALLSRLIALTPEDTVYLARHPHRPRIDDLICALMTDFFEQCGDRYAGEDPGVLGGIARFHGRPVTVIGTRKGHSLEENMAYHFGMPEPEGYRKALRLMKQAEKFGRPVLTFIDTPGAYPGMEAEARGQGEAIAQNLAQMSQLAVPVISVITGEGSSGGALALGVADSMLMLEHAFFSVVSPEGFASILWKDAGRKAEACGVMQLTAADMLRFGVIDGIVPEPVGGAQRDPAALYAALDAALTARLDALSALSAQELTARRYEKYRRV